MTPITKSDLDRWLGFGVYGGKMCYTVCRWQAVLMGVSMPPRKGWMRGLVGRAIADASRAKLDATIPIRKRQRQPQPQPVSGRRLLEELRLPENRHLLDALSAAVRAKEATKPPSGPIDLDNWKFDRILPIDDELDREAREAAGLDMPES